MDIMHEALEQARANADPERRMRRSTSPKIAGVMPGKGSPKGGLLVTIYGENLRSKKIDLGGQESESDNEGENYNMWFEREHNGQTWKVPCNIDRMLQLHGRPIDGHGDFLVCETNEMPRFYTFYFKMTIDGGPILSSGHWRVEFKEGYAPTADWFYPANSARAFPSGQWDYHGEWWTDWFDTDDNSDGIEDESFIRHFMSDRKQLQNCNNPIGIEVFNKETLKPYEDSKNQNADGNPQSDYMTAVRGFRCTDSMQTVDPKTGNRTISCPDTKVRYRCIPGIVQMRGKIYTAVHGRSDHPDFHVNRLHESPKIINQADGWTAEAVIHLNDGKDCGSHPNCGQNLRLNYELTSGNDGVMHMLSKANIPGAYNFTYETHHQGAAVVNKRLFNYLTNENLYPANFEVYPQIDSVYPHGGSLNGGTLLTIYGSGFIPDGLGGTVTVTIGETECEIQSMTESMITCKTIAQEETEKSWIQQRIESFVNTDGTSNDDGDHRRYNWGLDKIKSAQECLELCAQDPVCRAYAYHQNEPKSGCVLFDYHGDSAEQETAHRDEKWHPREDAESGYIPFSARPAEETNCYTGRGELYQGEANTGKGARNFGAAFCEDGTFCRNPTPENDRYPYCINKVDGKKFYCRIALCGEHQPKYLGNRGVQMEIVEWGGWMYWWDIYQMTPGYFWNPLQKWTQPFFYGSSGKDYMFYGQKSGGDYLKIRGRTNFVAPMDGIYSFTILSDDHSELKSGVNPETGAYDFDWGVTARSTDSVYDYAEYSVTKRHELKKGESLYLEAIMTEHTGDDRMQVSVHYHGKNEETGVWQDRRAKEYFPQSNYAYSRSELYFDLDGQHDATWITMKVDHADIEANLGNGEHWDKRGGLQFKIKQCGDHNQCYETETIDTKKWNSGQLEDWIKENWLATQCKHNTMFKPLHYHGTYETERTWPGRHHFEKGQGAYCGRYAHETHNHDVWNSHMGGSFSTNTFQDMCFAYKGEIHKLQVYGKYWRAEDGREVRNWMEIPVSGMSSKDKFKLHCFKLKDTLDSKYGSLKDDKKGYSISNIRLYNDDGAPVYVDELHVGQMRDRSFNIQQLNIPLTIDGQIPTKVNIDYWGHGYGGIFLWQLQAWDSEANCGYKSKLPTIEIADDVDGRKSSGTNNGGNWERDKTYKDYEIHDGFNDYHIFCDSCNSETPRDYNTRTLDYKRADNSRMTAKVWVYRHSIVNEEIDVEVKLTLDGYEEELKFDFTKDYYAKHLKEDMIATWPFLGNTHSTDLDISVSRGGWCNDGYTFSIKSQQHGRMPKINMETKLISRAFNPVFYAENEFTSGVTTQYMPGSVTATAHDVPQVVIMANGQRSACDSCDFVWSEDFTVEMLSFEHGDTDLVKGDTVTVTFDVKQYADTLENLQVLVSDSQLDCDTSNTVVDGTVHTMTCEIVNVPVSNKHNIRMYIPEVGDVPFETDQTFTTQTAVDSYSPNVGSKHGGTVVTALGRGFAPGQVITVKIGGQDTQCDSAGFEVSYERLQCATRPNSRIDGSHSPVVDSISADGFTHHGGEVVTITGSGFSSDCDDQGYVALGKEKAKIISWSDTEIVAESIRSKNFQNEDSELLVYVCNKGYGDRKFIETGFRVTKVYNSFQSLMGGRELDIRGNGFASYGGKNVDTSVTIGDDIPCDITEITPERIKCNPGPYGNTVNLEMGARGFSNKDTDQDGTYQIVEEGQEVVWTWALSLGGVVPVVEFQHVSKGKAEGRSKWSEEITGTRGKFSKIFTSRGVYHYSTGYIDGATLFISGTIEVVKATDKPLKVNVRSNGKLAPHFGSSTNKQPSRKSCEYVADTVAVENPDNDHHVTFSWGATPVMKSFKVEKKSPGFEDPVRHPPNSDATIFLNGINNVQARDCGNSGKAIIHFGAYQCEITKNDGYFGCDIKGDGMNVNEPVKIDVILPKMGRAFYSTQRWVDGDEDAGIEGKYVHDKDIVYFAAIGTEIEPNRMSRLGGRTVEITGAGFDFTQGVEVYFQSRNAESETVAQYPCIIATDADGNIDMDLNSYFKITCRIVKIASSANLANQQFDGKIMVGGEVFSFDRVYMSSDENYTPSVESIEPTEFSSGGETITIKGRRLDQTRAKVFVGGEECAFKSADSRTFTCKMPELTAGYHHIKFSSELGEVRVETEAQTTVKVHMSASGISPTGGVGSNGGERVTVTGFGFDEDVVVTVESASGLLLCEFCKKEVVSSTEIVFITPRNAEASAKVTVHHEFLATDIESFSLDYVETNSEVTASSPSADIVGSTTVKIDGTFDCSSTQSVEFYRARNPCEAGTHQCHHRAECIPSNDGLDYTCECDKPPEGQDLWTYVYGFGNGRECYHFRRREEVHYAELEGKCEQDGYFDYEINSEAKEEWFAEYLGNVQGKVYYGSFVKHYGVWKCLVLADHDTIPGKYKLDIKGDSAETCDNWGRESRDFAKRLDCVYNPNRMRNCVDKRPDEGQHKGRNSFYGWQTQTLGGAKCAKWSDIHESERYKLFPDYNTQLMNRENFCTNTWNSDVGPFCPLLMPGTDGKGVWWAECATPSCEEMYDITKRRNSCLISSVASKDDDIKSFLYSGWHEDYKNWDHDSTQCYLANHHDDKAENPRRCWNQQRYGYKFAIVPVEGRDGKFQVYLNGFGDRSQKFLVADIDDENDEVKIMKESKFAQYGVGWEETYWDIVDDAFIPGSSALRWKDYYIRAPKPTKCGIKDCHQLHLTHQDAIAGIDLAEFSFKFTCQSDNYGNLIDQAPPQATFIQSQAVSSCSTNQVTVSAPPLEAGAYKAVVAAGDGLSRGSVDLDFALSVESVSPSSIGQGGGTIITLSGNGFHPDQVISMCDEPLALIEYQDTTSVVYETNRIPRDCSSPKLTISAFDESDDSAIEATFPDDASRKRRAGGFNIDDSLTPKIVSVEPKMGGTAGGTKLTISGSGFGAVVDDATVTVYGASCTVDSVTDSTIICETSAFPRVDAETGALNKQVPVTPEVLIAGGPGYAMVDDEEDESHQFWYIDRWSSPYTWGCSDDSCKPQAGEIIVIPEGQVILLDETTPHLAVLIIDGGTMIWARKGGIELHMDYGIVNNGGHFEIGTEEEPFCSGTALIKLYGHQRSINLPIYGAKVFAIRFGTIDIHGCPKTTTWCELDQTAEPGDTEIVLTHPVHDDWFVDNEIIIAATGDITNFHRSEKRVITAVSEDGYTLTLDKPLEHTHLSVCNNGPGDNGLGFGWAGEICMRAEVGLLTRNVKMMGNVNTAFSEELDECELGAGLAMGVQTCFQNRYGHETGSDQFGSVLFIHKPDHAKIEYMEVTHAGQAFNLARYPIHFHQPGSLPDSYVRGCGIHNTFNRALTMHGVHNLTVEYNVIYNVMGLAFFLEDAVEEDNVLRYNLGIMNKKSSSLLNVDSTPAVFWIPNPNNIFYGNRAAGSTHFGFWFNPPDHPTGPSAKDERYQNFCVKNRPLGLFYNNTAHSMGQYGMWVFTDLTPTVNGLCEDTEPKAIKFGEIPAVHHGNGLAFSQEEREALPGFFAWHCLRGAEVATGGAMHFVNFIASNNWIAGLSWKETFLHTFALDDREDQASMYKRSIVIGHIGGHKDLDACGDMGIETPWKFFAFTVDDIRFYNYDEPTPELAASDLSTYPTKSELPGRRCVAFDPCYGSNAFDCGAITYFKNVKWDNCARRVTFAWEHEAAIHDIDGSFAGLGGERYIVAHSDHFDPKFCTKDTSGKYDLGVDASICKAEVGGQKFRLHRFMFNNPQPESMKGTMAVFTNQHGVTKSGFRNCRPRGEGWMVLLQGHNEYQMTFDQHGHVSNISYTGDIDDFEKTDWLTLRHDFPERVDEANMNGKMRYAKLSSTGVLVNETAGDVWPADPLELEPYAYHIDKEEAPFSIKYTFNGQMNTEDPQVTPTCSENPDGEGTCGANDGAFTNGEAFFISPDFYKCFFKDCIVPEPAPPTPPPVPVPCDFNSCVGNLEDWADLQVDAAQHVKVDKAAIQSKGLNWKFGKVFLEGTMEFEADAFESGDHLVIEADHILLNTPNPDGDSEDEESGARRRRRDTQEVTNGGLIIGTKENPIPCDVTITIKIAGDEFSKSYGALPDSIPIGAKALGGLGSIRMHGCPKSRTWTTLTNTINAGDTIITVDDDIVDWNVGEEIVIAATDHTHRHTEYFTITEKDGKTITLDKAVEFRHLGTAETSKTLLGRDYHQGAEVAILSRNIKLDGSEGADGKVGARILITSFSEQIAGHDYLRRGVGQFENVEFKGFGQFGHDRYDDHRCQILFYNINGLLPEEEINDERENSYVKGCAFHHGYHSAVVAFDNSNNIEISNNVIFGTVGSAINTDSDGLVIEGNIIGNVYQTQLFDLDYFGTTVNANFADDLMPAGIDTEKTKSVTVRNNRVAGVDGSCYAGNGEECDASESCNSSNNGSSDHSNNIGHSCNRGYYVLRVGHACTKVSGYTFWKIGQIGLMFLTVAPVKNIIVDDTIVVDSRLAIGSIMGGPDSTAHMASPNTLTVKRSVIIGKDSTFDCDYDNDLMFKFPTSEHIKRQAPNLGADESAAFIIPEFLAGGTGFPACAIMDLDNDVAMYGKTCVLDTAISEFNGKCGGKDYIVTANKKGNMDHTFAMDFMSGNSCTNCKKETLVKFLRPDTKNVNVADCVDMHCDGKKKAMIVDGDGGIFGTAGTFMAESEFEWDGITRGGHTYRDTRDGLGDYRIPNPMRTTSSGGRIPYNQVYQEAGIIRDASCKYETSYGPGWFCPLSAGLKYHDLVYEMMDEDHMNRRLTPLAVRGTNKGIAYLDLINGPGDHSCCIGYACQIRLMTMHTTVACGFDYDYYFSSTLPLEARFHFPHAPADCKIKVAFYTKRPNRVDIFKDDVFQVPKNAQVS